MLKPSSVCLNLHQAYLMQSCSHQCGLHSSVMLGTAVAIRCCSVPGCTAAVSRGAKLPAAVCGPAQSNHCQHPKWGRSGRAYSQAAAAGQPQAAAARQTVQTARQTPERQQSAGSAGQFRTTCICTQSNNSQQSLASNNIHKCSDQLHAELMF